MKETYSIMQSQHNLSQVLREVAAGYEVNITRHKKSVARIVPSEESDRVEFPDFAERSLRIWGGPWTGASSDELLDESRGKH